MENMNPVDKRQAGNAGWDEKMRKMAGAKSDASPEWGEVKEVKEKESRDAGGEMKRPFLR